MPKTSDIIFIGNIAFAVILLIFNCGPFVFSENRAFNEKLYRLRNKQELGEKPQQPIDKATITKYSISYKSRMAAKGNTLYGKVQKGRFSLMDNDFQEAKSYLSFRKVKHSVHVKQQSIHQKKLSYAKSKHSLYDASQNK
mmetsp:Transcript_12602/g.21204  ORF Transcript_12602/g.21204 Transcript_12602/m.21204 type:complete len:140 (+) Transcript_12602:1442-1861(+)